MRQALLAWWRTGGGLSPTRLLIAAAIFHLVVTVTVFSLGRYAVLPGTFDRNGSAVSFAPDSATFHDEAAELSETLQRGEFINWFSAHQPLHIRLYSICFALFGPLLGENIISAEPLNLLYYLTILILVFKLGREAFGQRVGLFAAAVVALWPSLLLHTTQLLRDQLFIIGMLAFVLILLRWLTRTYSWPQALLIAAAGALIAALIWLARDNLGGIMIAAGIAGAGLLAAQQFKQRRVQTTNLVGMALMLALTIGVTQILPKFRQLEVRRPAVRQPLVEGTPKTPWGRVAAHIARVRLGFTQTYPDAGSNIDSDVQFHGLADIIRYLPRAAAIGFFAPFPNMWLAPGKQVGSSGRLLIGAESLMMYLIEALAVYGLWRGRRLFHAWLLFLVSAIGMISLGMVVVNVGALYRLRYLFLITVIILGVEGALQALGRMSKKPSEAEESSEAEEMSAPA
jgi:hypothetical protein